MTQTSTYVKDPTTGIFSSQGAPGMLPVTASNGTSPATNQINVPYSTGSANLDQVLGIPAGAPPPPAGSNPYTIFNQHIASILSQIQNSASVGRANLGGAANTLTNESISSAGAYNPQATPGVNIQNQSGTMGAFAPALTSINTQLANANADISGLNQAIPAIQAANQPQVVSGGSSLVTPSGQNLGTAPVYNPAINPVTLQPYGWSQAPGSGTGGGSSGGTSGVATSTGNVDLSTYSTNPNYTPMMQKQYTSTSTELQNLMQQMGGDSASVMTQYIKNNAPKSQITGAMVNSVANQYGIDPSFLASQMLLETDFGTAGEAPANNNPGGVKYAGQAGATRGTPAPDGGDYAKFASWQQGIAAEASEIARRQNTGSSPQSNQSGINIVSDAQALANGSMSPQVAQAKYKDFPALYLQAVAMAKQINPAFNETASTLKYQGQQTQTENVNSGNPLTSIYSNLKNLVTNSPGSSIFSPLKSKSVLSNGVDLSQFNQ